MSTQVQSLAHPRAPERKAGRQRSDTLIALLVCFGVARLLLQVAINSLAIHAGYGIYRDELYYLVCGNHLAAGYVDHPPLVALQARLADLLFGHTNLIAFRLLPALAGSLTVVLTGLLATTLGGTRKAAALAMLAVLPAPVLLATQSFISMNAWDPVFWMTAMLALLRVIAVPTATKWWAVLGLSVGLAFENKASVLFFIAALLLALLVTSARRVLSTRGFLLAVGLTLLLSLPNLGWQAAHGFPTWEWLKDVQHSDKDVLLPPLQFLLHQVLMLSPLHLLIWLPGLLWLLVGRTGRPWRTAGLLYLFFLAIMMALHAKEYYLAPIYPLLFAAGAVFWTEWAAASKVRGRVIAAYAILMTMFVAFSAPFAVPVFSPSNFVFYSHFMHFEPTDIEQHTPTLLPEFFADHLDWQLLVEDVSRTYHALPAAEQQQTGIITSNYGQASAIDILGKPLGLPEAISGHQNFWLWGPRGYSGKEMIVVTDASPAVMRRVYRSCTVADRQTYKYQMPWEQRYIYVCRDRYQPFGSSWDAVKLYR